MLELKSIHVRCLVCLLRGCLFDAYLKASMLVDAYLKASMLVCYLFKKFQCWYGRRACIWSRRLVLNDVKYWRRIRSGHVFNPASNIHFHVCLKARFSGCPSYTTPCCWHVQVQVLHHVFAYNVSPIVQHSTLQNSTVQYSTVQYSTAGITYTTPCCRHVQEQVLHAFASNITPTAQYSTLEQYSKVQYTTLQYTMLKYRTIQWRSTVVQYCRTQLQYYTELWTCKSTV